MISLRAASLSIEQSYDRLEIYRRATLAACLYPPFCPEAMSLFHQAAEIERGIEELIQVDWNLQKTSWEIGAPTCKNPFSTRFSQFPDFPYKLVDPEADLLPLDSTHFDLNGTPSLTLRLQLKPLVSAATLERRGSHDWRIRWTE